jgi:hypothetical protein
MNFSLLDVLRHPVLLSLSLKYSDHPDFNHSLSISSFKLRDRVSHTL